MCLESSFLIFTIVIIIIITIAVIIIVVVDINIITITGLQITAGQRTMSFTDSFREILTFNYRKSYNC